MSISRGRFLGSALAALIVVSGVAALLMAIVAEMPIDLLMNLVALALLSLTTIAALGWVVLQRQSTVSGGKFYVEQGGHSE